MRTLALATSLLGLAATGCFVEATDVGSNRDGPSFEEFAANIYHEPGEYGVYIVNGDEPIANDKKLREYYDLINGDGALIVHAPGGTVAKWNAAQKDNLTYCVSNSFGARKTQVVQAMNAAAGAWEAAADIDFIHDSGQDGNCTATNANVLFDVRPISGAPYTARAFFPNDARSTRNVIIDSTAFSGGGSVTLTGVLRHELGHALGFRHEHTRPEASSCYEDSQWNPLTPYDSASVMHYPQCNGTGNDLSITSIDVTGARALYGAPGGGGDDPAPPTGPGTPRTDEASGWLGTGQVINYEGLPVVPGSYFDVVMVGTGDADLYVRFDAEPTWNQFHCRPYGNTSNEACLLDVPAGASQAFISIHGYTSTTFSLAVAWVSPD